MNKFFKNFLVVITCALLLASCKNAVSTDDETPNAGAAAPVVGEISPLASAIEVPVTSDITAVFSAAMDEKTINTTSFVVKSGDVSIDGVVTFKDKTATFNPVADLAALTTYSVTLVSGVKDSSGTPMAENKTWSFTTALVPDVIAPVVSSSLPMNLQTAVVLNSNVTAIFSEPMKGDTLTAATFTLMKGATAIAGTVSYAGSTVTFDPTATLEANTVYTATLTTGVQDISLNAMAANKVWSFTTGNALDTVAPCIVSSIPEDLATGVACKDAITVVFSEKMDPTTINASTVSLSKGGSPISGTLMFSGLTVSFAPSIALEGNTVYTVSVTTGVKDLAGNAMLSAKSWSFATVRGPAIVNLGSAGDFVILAEAGIDSIPTSSITGNIGVSPLAATYLTHFSLTMDGTGTFSKSGQVIGKVYASDYAAPTPAYLTTAIGDLQIADDDISGRLNPDFLDLGTGNVSGQTLSPGLYKWNTGLTMTTDVTLNGGPNDVWIFQVSGVLYMGADVKVTLAGGAQAKNIFWKINSGLLNSNAHIEGNVISKTAINFSTGASINGRLLTHTAVNLDACTVTMPK